jgi:hypothetical protein
MQNKGLDFRNKQVFENDDTDEQNVEEEAGDSEA